MPHGDKKELSQVAYDARYPHSLDGWDELHEVYRNYWRAVTLALLGALGLDPDETAERYMRGDYDRKTGVVALAFPPPECTCPAEGRHACTCNTARKEETK